MSELNQGSEQNTQNSINETGGIPEIELTLEVSGMTQTPVDKSLSISDMAADAKVTGDRFANVESDIFRIDGNIADLSARTGDDILISGDVGAGSISDAVADAMESIGIIGNYTGENIKINSESGADTIANVVAGAIDTIGTMQTAITGLEAKTGEDIAYSSDPESPSIKETVDALSDDTTTAIEGLRSDTEDAIEALQGTTTEAIENLWTAIEGLDVTEMTTEEIDDIFDEVFNDE